jgi:hypothetical protein
MATAIGPGRALGLDDTPEGDCDLETFLSELAADLGAGVVTREQANDLVGLLGQPGLEPPWLRPE